MFKKGLLMAAAFMVSMNVVAKPDDSWVSQLSELTNAAGVSGFERSIGQLVKSHWLKMMTRVSSDKMGNVFGYVKPDSKKPRVLFMAHMDEVGFMVQSINEDGFIKVIPLGGIEDNVLLAQRWVISTAKGPVKAYSGLEAIHLIDKDYRSTAVNKKAMFLDIGAKSKDEVINQYGIRPGLAVTPDSQLEKLGSSRYLAKALDDRLGLVAITETVKQLKNTTLPNQLITAATVQEEIGLRGASTVYASVKPDVVINVEIGIADDFPLLLSDGGSDIKLGSGPSLFVYDRSMIPNQALVQWITQLAKKNNIPFQYELETGYGEDGAKLQVSGQGVPVINIGIPVRYAHEHAGVFDANDFNNATKLLTLIAKNLDEKTIKKLTA